MRWKKDSDGSQDFAVAMEVNRSTNDYRRCQEGGQVMMLVNDRLIRLAMIVI